MPDQHKVYIAVCQFPVGNDPRENGAYIRQQMLQAKRDGADIAHFPECALTGYPGYEGYQWHGFDWTAIRHETEAIMAEAGAQSLWVVFGSAHRLSGDHKPHNCAYVINAEGRVEDRYDKRFVTQGDLKHYTPGDHPTVFTVSGVRFGVYICYEKWFPELFRDYKKRGVHCLLDSIHSPERDHTLGTDKECIDDAERALWIACARLNHVWISVSNHSRPDQDNTSFLVDPDGGLQKLPFKEPWVSVFEIDAERDFWDPSGPFRDLALSGAMHNGEIMSDPRSRDHRSL